MGEVSGEGGVFYPWRADFAFRSEMTRAEMSGSTVALSFEHLATTLIGAGSGAVGVGLTTVLRFGEELLIGAQPMAVRDSVWSFRSRDGWYADVKVRYLCDDLSRASPAGI
ncbi:hypothetical protein ACWC5I_35585 [Kitasatospora sp. NPDC001574]